MRGQVRVYIALRVVVRRSYIVLDIDLGPSVQQACHGVRILVFGGIHQGRRAALHTES
jgi:hypothetical protein